MLSFNSNTLWKTLIACSVVILGVLIKNGTQQFRKSKGQSLSNNVFYTSMMIFVVGWIAVAYMLIGSYASDKRKWVVSLACLGIVIAVGVMMLVKRHNHGYLPKNIKLFSILFIGSWFLLGYSLGIDKSNKSRLFGIAGAVSIITSMIISMPWQRDNKVIDGPGMGLFFFGWVLIAAGNSLQ